MITRTIQPYLAELAKKYPVVTVTGPRQSGKTTLCRMAFPDREYVNLESLDVREFATEDPRGFLARYPDGTILDEIQRVPELLSYIQTIVDEDSRKGLFILTGSHHFDVSTGISQSLAGRTALLRLLPFSLDEIEDTYGLDSADRLILHGCYPRIYNDELNPTQALADYFETYVERDLRHLVNIRNLSLFQRFVRLCAGRAGQILNLDNLANDAGVSHTTARSWLTLLEASYIVFLLQPFHRNISKRLIKSPKLYFYDVGLASYLLGIENENQVNRDPLRGNLFENLVVAESLKYRFNQGKRSNLNFYRDRSGNEVDLVINLGLDPFPVEIKAGETVNRDFFKGLRYFARIFPDLPREGALVYGGPERMERSGVLVCSWRRVHQMLRELDDVTC